MGCCEGCELQVIVWASCVVWAHSSCQEDHKSSTSKPAVQSSPIFHWPSLKLEVWSMTCGWRCCIRSIHSLQNWLPKGCHGEPDLNSEISLILKCSLNLPFFHFEVSKVIKKHPSALAVDLIMCDIAVRCWSIFTVGLRRIDQSSRWMGSPTLRQFRKTDSSKWCKYRLLELWGLCSLLHGQYVCNTFNTRDSSKPNLHYSWSYLCSSHTQCAMRQYAPFKGTRCKCCHNDPSPLRTAPDG